LPKADKDAKLKNRKTKGSIGAGKEHDIYA
jgi:hypothetical protein